LNESDSVHPSGGEIITESRERTDAARFKRKRLGDRANVRSIGYSFQARKRGHVPATPVNGRHRDAVNGETSHPAKRRKVSVTLSDGITVQDRRTKAYREFKKTMQGAAESSVTCRQRVVKSATLPSSDNTGDVFPPGVTKPGGRLDPGAVADTDRSSTSEDSADDVLYSIQAVVEDSRPTEGKERVGVENGTGGDGNVAGCNGEVVGHSGANGTVKVLV